MRHGAARLVEIMHLVVLRPGLILLVLVVQLSLLSSISLGQLPGGAQRATIEKLAFEAEWNLDASGGGVHSLVEATGISAAQLRSSIYVRDPFDSQPRWVAEGEFPTWSPDGARLAYCTRDGAFYGQIRIVNANGKGSRQLTHLKSGACFPEWSPDGKQIAITMIDPVSTKLAILDENGTLLRELGAGSAAHWSPDGKQLVYLRPLPHLQPGGSIWIMAADGSGAREILDDRSRGVQANWLPDGTGIIFSSERDGMAAVYTVGLDGKNVRKLGADPLMNWLYPVLSPDGKSLIVEAVTSPDETIKRVSVVEIDAGSPRAKLLATGTHFSVFWGKPAEPKTQKAEKDQPPAH